MKKLNPRAKQPCKRLPSVLAEIEKPGVTGRLDIRSAMHYVVRAMALTEGFDRAASVLQDAANLQDAVAA